MKDALTLAVRQKCCIIQNRRVELISGFFQHFLALFSILQKLCSRLLTFSLPVFWHFLQRFGRKVCFSSNSKVFTSQTLEALSWRTIKFKLNSQRNAKKNYSKIKVQRSEYCLTKNKIFAILFCDTIFSLF